MSGGKSPNPRQLSTHEPIYALPVKTKPSYYNPIPPLPAKKPPALPAKLNRHTVSNQSPSLNPNPLPPKNSPSTRSSSIERSRVSDICNTFEKRIISPSNRSPSLSISTADTVSANYRLEKSVNPFTKISNQSNTDNTNTKLHAPNHNLLSPPNALKQKQRSFLTFGFGAGGSGPSRRESHVNVNVTPTSHDITSDTPEIRKYKKRFNSEILCAALWGVNLLIGTENGLMLLDRSGQGKVNKYFLVQ